MRGADSIETELLEAGDTVAPQFIRNSNTYSCGILMDVRAFEKHLLAVNQETLFGRENVSNLSRCLGRLSAFPEVDIAVNARAFVVPAFF